MKETVAPLLQLAQRLKPRHDDDWMDRNHYLRTASILLCMALVVAAKQYVGQPIQCWAPNEVARNRAWMQYAEGYCFAEDTYYVAMDEHFPMQAVERERREIHYYQWVPFILVGMALVLYLPKLVWNAFSWRSGFDVRRLVSRAQELASSGEFGAQERAAKELAGSIHKALLQNMRKAVRDPNDLDAIPEYPYCSKPVPALWFLTVQLLLFKALNLLVVLGQFHMLTEFLAGPEDGHYWAVTVVQDLMVGRDWHETGAFPRVTFCDFNIRQATQGTKPLRYTFQCVLMINMFNEKLFLFIWFWLLGMALCGSLNILVWLYRICAGSHSFIKGQMSFNQHQMQMPHERDIRQFVSLYLSHDGVTVLRLIKLNCDPLVSSMLVGELFKRFNCGIRAAKFQQITKLEGTRRNFVNNGA